VADRLSDAELWRAVERTLREVLLPAIGDEHQWPRAVAVQLAGLARYAAGRPPDQSAARAGELRAVIAELGTNAIIGQMPPDASDADVFEVAGRALAAAVDRDDDDARQVRTVLRPLLVRQLDDELAVTSPLVDAFRGRLGD
jgi:hypothetical protein